MDISVTRAGAHAAVGGTVGGVLVSFNGVDSRLLGFGVGTGAAAGITQSLVTDLTGNAAIGLGLGIGAGAATGAAMFQMLAKGASGSQAARSGTRALAAGAALGAGIALVGGFVGAGLVGRYMPALPPADG